MPAIIYEQDSEININEGSFDETLATPIAGRDLIIIIMMIVLP